MKRLISSSVLAFVLSSCSFPDVSGERTTTEVLLVDNVKDSVAIKKILSANHLDTGLISAVSKIYGTSSMNRTLDIELNDFRLDTLRIPDGIAFGTSKIIFSARGNHFKSWQQEVEKIPGLISLDFSQDTLSSFYVGNGNPSLSDLSFADCRLNSISLPLDRFPGMTSINLNGNFLTDLPAAYTVTHIKVSVRGNSICNPSTSLDEFLKRNDQQWRNTQICH